MSSVLSRRSFGRVGLALRGPRLHHVLSLEAAAELLAWLESQTDEWINGEVKVSRNGKMYVQRDTWKPNQGERQESRKPAQSKAPQADSFDDSDSIPF